MFAASGVVRYDDFHDLHRHVSHLRKRLKSLAPGVSIDTLIGEGYEVTTGFDQLYRLLHQGEAPSLRAHGFTVKQTAILKLISLRGSAHKDQIACLQRHMSNIRAKLPSSIKIITHPGEGLYTADEHSRAQIARLLSGELETKPKRQPKQLTRLKPSSPKLALVVSA